MVSLSGTNRNEQATEQGRIPPEGARRKTSPGLPSTTRTGTTPTEHDRGGGARLRKDGLSTSGQMEGHCVEGIDQVTTNKVYTQLKEKE